MNYRAGLAALILIKASGCFLGSAVTVGPSPWRVEVGAVSPLPGPRYYSRK
jgi:hypothetical protein